MRSIIAAFSLCLVAFLTTSADAHARHHRHHHSHHIVIVHHAQFDAVGDQLFSVFGAPSLEAVSHDTRSGLVTIETAAGISITVASNAAPKFEGFIRDLVAEGYRPHHIGCYARGGHVSHSLHYSGNACDFDQTGWNKTAGTMYHVGSLAEKWGLRDGCTFVHPRKDCGHIDTGFGGTQFAHHHYRHYARG